MENKIKTITPSLFKKFMKFLFYRQLMIIVLMQRYECTRQQAKNLYNVYNEIKK